MFVYISGNNYWTDLLGKHLDSKSYYLKYNED